MTEKGINPLYFIGKEPSLQADRARGVANPAPRLHRGEAVVLDKRDGELSSPQQLILPDKSSL